MKAQPPSGDAVKDLDLISTDVAGMSDEKIEELLRAVHTIPDLSEICQGFALKSGYLYYLAVFSNDKVPFLLTQYPPEWYIHYKQMGYWSKDPVLTTAFKTFHGFFWEDIPRDDDNTRVFFADASAHGVGEGFSVTARGPDNTQLLFCLAARKRPEPRPGVRREDVMMRAHWFALQALQAGCRIVKGPTPFAVTEIPLTDRERFVLELLADGHGGKEIARRMDISVTRVNQYLDNLKGKFAAGTREEMLVKAAKRGLVDRTVFPTVLNYIEEDGIAQGQDHYDSKARIRAVDEDPEED